MNEGALADIRILIAEDDYMLASDTARLFRQAGATVIGPVATVAQVQERIMNDEIDVAVLDIRLDSEIVFAAADQIMHSGPPFAFVTGYDEEAIPQRFAEIPRCQKPCADEILIDIVRKLHAR